MSYRRRETEEKHLHASAGEKNEFLRPKLSSAPNVRSGSGLRLLRHIVCWRYILSWLCFWICLVQYYENTVVKRAMSRCQWSRWENWPRAATPHHMAVLADPQIMDAHSYPGRPWVVNYFTQQVVDNYHARNWKHLHHTLDPDSTFFLGDLFDGGRRWNDSEWITEYSRFNRIFPKKPNRLTVMSLPGNHDIGFGDTVMEKSLSRFQVYFGDPSTKWNVGNHTVVLLDTISLSDTQNQEVSAVPRNFLDQFAQTPESNPRILLTHVPLWRDPNTQVCGPKRESLKPFPMAKGDQYQTVIDADLSQEVLQKTAPSLVLSGDDHDYCHITHSYSSERGSQVAEEITVKSCAMNMGISRPAIQLLSLYNPEQSQTSEDTLHTSICYLPDPYKALQVYIGAYVLTLLFVASLHFAPTYFNKAMSFIAHKMTRDATTLLPVAAKKASANISHDDLSYLSALNGFERAKCFLINASLMTLMIFLVFTFHYTKK
ncbi:LAME_0E03972g1_1 [Lachancea meyersii CBS 8951]|uniref:LAME_0E03972g1_1 n=1 Tax=Lachancea meyersii CBS 8951 TaxID=1266667 RepID=A0A1G4JGY4_9SACH|nr:LAME_0E03972g1_1 [Lachancea meyersii CBS 8951]